MAKDPKPPSDTGQPPHQREYALTRRCRRSFDRRLTWPRRQRRVPRHALSRYPAKPPRNVAMSKGSGPLRSRTNRNRPGLRSDGE